MTGGRGPFRTWDREEGEEKDEGSDQLEQFVQ